MTRVTHVCKCSLDVCRIYSMRGNHSPMNLQKKNKILSTAEVNLKKCNALSFETSCQGTLPVFALSTDFISLPLPSPFRFSYHMLGHGRGNLPPGVHLDGGNVKLRYANVRRCEKRKKIAFSSKEIPRNRKRSSTQVMDESKTHRRFRPAFGTTTIFVWLKWWGNAFSLKSTSNYRHN